MCIYGSKLMWANNVIVTHAEEQISSLTHYITTHCAGDVLQAAVMPALFLPILPMFYFLIRQGCINAKGPRDVNSVLCERALS